MNFLEKINEMSKRLERESEQWLEETRIEIAAKQTIKSDNFSSETEKRIMLEAAEKERQRKNELASKLEADPILAKYFHEAMKRIGPHMSDPETVRSVRIAEEAAMKCAFREKEIQMRLDGRGSEFRKRYEKARTEVEAAIRKVDS